MSKKIALVTGGSRGIGRATALNLSRNGMDVAINYLQARKESEEVVRLIEEMGRRALSVRADVSDPSEVEQMAKVIEGELGEVDVLVNNAGLYKRVKFDQLGPEDWHRTIEVDLTGVYNCCKVFVTSMVEKGWGRIINISSIIGFKGSRYGAHYAAAKAGVVGFTRSLAIELAAKGITVNAVAPGPIDTELLAYTEEDRRRRIREIPVGRLGRPEDIASVVAFLASDETDFMTGEVLIVDGGLLITSR